MTVADDALALTDDLVRLRQPLGQLPELMAVNGSTVGEAHALGDGDVVFLGFSGNDDGQEQAYSS